MGCAMTRQRKITTASALKRRETQAQRIQHAIDSTAEIARLSARVDELQRELALARITVRGLRRRLDGVECEDGE
jgi:hypothetical protein